MNTKKISQHPLDQPRGSIMVDGNRRAWAFDHPILPPVINVDDEDPEYRTEPGDVAGEIIVEK